MQQPACAPFHPEDSLLVALPSHDRSHQAYKHTWNANSSRSAILCVLERAI